MSGNRDVKSNTRRTLDSDLRNDPLPFDEWYIHFKPSLIHSLFRSHPRLSWPEIEDSLSETMLAVIENDIDGTLQNRFAYILKGARNHIINGLRRGNRSTELEESILDSMAHGFFEERLVDQDLIKFLLSELTAFEREVILARYHEGFSPEEIAIRNGKTIKAIYLTCDRIKKKLLVKWGDLESNFSGESQNNNGIKGECEKC